jgi:hypothetical protein
MNIGETGAWQNNSLEGHIHSENNPFFDESLAETMLRFFHKNDIGSLYDFGCGGGFYTKYFRDHNLVCYGYDGNPYTPNITNGLCEVLDLSTSVELPPQDLVLSLEVGEHLPPQFESTFIDNIHKHNTKIVIISWAIEGQGGWGHFNERNNSYIKQKFLDLGYFNDIDEEKVLRSASSLPWFKNTIMVFRKNSL